MTGQNITPYFEKLYDLTKEKTLAYITAKCANLFDVQDIFQETYTEVFATVKRKGENYVQNETAFVIAVAKLKLAKHYKGKEKIIFTPLYNGDDEPIEIPDEINIENVIVDEGLIRLLFERLGEYPLETQKIFYLRYYLDMKVSEIAVLMEMSESVIKHRLYRTINEMRTYFDNMEG